MFQIFEIPGSSRESASRIGKLRQLMKRADLDAYLVPHGDEYQNEYLPPSAERLAWLTGFTGSAGFCVIMTDQAVLFVDGRYTLQAGRQTDASVIAIRDLLAEPPAKWMAGAVEGRSRIGFDPWLLTIGQKKRFADAIEDAGAELVSAPNLVDEIWSDRPAPSAGKVALQDLEFAGESAVSKVGRMEKKLREAKADCCLVTDPASIAWIFNIRGSDIVHTPVPLGFALLRVDNKPIVFLSAQKLDDDTRSALEQICDIRSPDALETELAQQTRAAKVLCDPDRVASRLAEIVEAAGGEVIEGRDPAILARAIKNDAELAGSRAAHLRDGVAMCRFLAWLDGIPPGSCDEIGAAKRLERFREETAQRMNSQLREISFDTISAAGANGAIVHYRVDEQSNSRLVDGSLYLVDSGGQYVDGTTDITRTVAVGEPPAGAAEDFTLVLKGHIAIATARFPEGTRGIDLDPLARIALWQNGRDYAHGTGHGVGSYLSVHEGPQGISRRSMEPLQAGMIVSNEPGYYVEGKYGIRIENLVLVKPLQHIGGGNIAVHEFETLTLAPVDRRLIDSSALTESESHWLNGYHRRVCSEVSPWLEGADLEWLEQATRPI